ncbi:MULTISPECIES: hypothetical protein [Caproicibacterium]|uniref:ASCH domain-containing protein n=1 Tax=Caproicibacterium argilliputei TaxID=3030016 RepID=A0AA97D9Q5_9FIRM|nr:hypothetical protein [Caproicibacterium argilliputei]WOC32349.1 hypothetical protein PXC00_00345 [Caproicibacterium argilliputei]
MQKMLLSINPEHVVNILNGSKKYEFRKRKCKQPVRKIVMYETAPTMLVIGEVDILEIIEDSPEKVWSETSSFSGVNKSFFDHYYQGHDIAVAYKLGKIKKFKRPRSLSDYGLHQAPQSFAYV